MSGISEWKLVLRDDTPRWAGKRAPLGVAQLKERSHAKEVKYLSERMAPQALTEPDEFQQLLDAHTSSTQAISADFERAISKQVDFLRKFAWRSPLTENPTTSVHSALGVFRKEVERAADTTNAEEAMLAIEELLEKLDDESSYAEARMRRLLRKLPEPRLGDEPEWLSAGLEELAAPNDVSKRVISSVRRLIRHFLAHADLHGLSPSFAPAPHGAIEVEWSEKLTWIVYPPLVGWPAVHVRIYGGADAEGRSTAPRTFRFCTSVATQSAKLLEL